MFRILIFCLISFSLFSQPREERPLPEYREEPIKTLEEGITGWSYSKDGQWVKGKGHIPIVSISTKEENYETDQAQVGLDNIDQLWLEPIKYGDDTLVGLIKIYTEGFYEYPVTQRDWDERTNAYYFIFKKKGLEKLRNFEDTTVSNVRLNLMAGGLLKDIKTKHIIENIEKNTVVRYRYDRDLVFTMQKPANDTIRRFQFFSIHEIFPDVEGVLEDFTRGGRTVYGSTVLFDFLYYELSDPRFREFFSLPEENLFTVE